METAKSNNRKNAGRKKKWGEKTVIVSVRVPLSKVEQVKRVVKYLIANNIQDNL
jgi:hypothetical protein